LQRVDGNLKADHPRWLGSKRDWPLKMHMDESTSALEANPDNVLVLTYNS